jgi:hypothetical protein
LGRFGVQFFIPTTYVHVEKVKVGRLDYKVVRLGRLG